MDRGTLASWLERYERAWRTPGTAVLEELFAPDASYMNAPFEEPLRGIDAIAAMWEGERESPDEAFEMESEPIALERDTAVVRVEVRYGEPRPQVYRDIWIVTLGEDGRCSSFEEWPFWPPGSGGDFAGQNTREAG